VKVVHATEFIILETILIHVLISLVQACISVVMSTHFIE